MSPRAVRATLALGAALAGCAPEGPDVAAGVSLDLAAHRAAILSNVSYELGFDVPAEVDGDIEATAIIGFDLADPSSPLQLDFREDADHVRVLSVNGGEIERDFRNEHLVIPARALVEGRNVVSIDFVAGSTSLNRNPDYLYTLFVPDRARTAFPLFDQPDLKARFTLTLRVPAGWNAMSNAPVDRVHEEGDSTEYRFEESDLIPSYLFSFVAGRFEEVTRQVGGRSMTMLHRESDAEKVARNVDEIFRLHGAALDWLEDYTGIDYPYRKFGFALIPAFQYGGMEHVGAIQYRASSLFLDEAPTETELLGRAGLIAHETAHMWFGNLVTMAWFDDVWTKEVFANFMAAKIVNPSFPGVDHELNFLVRHYPGAYSVDRTPGANPIRQQLANLNEAGQMYGAIIYNKAPIMMRQLERMIGEHAFRDGMREYLSTYAFANATWPALIAILDRKTDEDLAAWSEVWVNSPGRPEFVPEPGTDYLGLAQADRAGLGRVWPQQFAVSVYSATDARTFDIDMRTASTPVLTSTRPDIDVILNADGYGYGLFPQGATTAATWARLDDVEKGVILVDGFENLLEGRIAAPVYADFLVRTIRNEENQLLLNLALRQLRRVCWSFLGAAGHREWPDSIESALWATLERHADAGIRKMLFLGYAGIALGDEHVERVYQVWSGELEIGDLPLSENERIDLARDLAIKLPARADAILAQQAGRTENPDNVRKLEFIAPSLSPDPAVRDRFFVSLADEARRETESWVLDALENLHHPLRIDASERYILPSLELLEEIQVTGDIFFPKRWLDETLQNHRSRTAVATVRRFLDERPDYNEQLTMKIRQSADMMNRANALAGGGDRP